MNPLFMDSAFCNHKYNHSFNIIEHEDIEEGINTFLKKHKTELLIMIAGKRNFITKMFEPSYTKKMTDQTKIPFDFESVILKNI